ncbi:antirepressor [Candidatus Uhrbacteria bacterium RIFCSPLOWO2_01_FULL_47_24]|uniref:Antirepressor n=1 Tax=Candidatus Uhrbacteria bacterium RIFCSPLOWO2_01_FULL_47_24 TaxID=1802401 RepID=A0A1F7UT05_9BACT|nr:MAG: antirepressor [Candidatus Uhrbacteria bacterium RIFCSPHIGHO2_01_FULL_47_11]OGL69052.1 MAG: antirepressor [Candidatus Uhrbacteria bacterium RIFCSPHIGHO2_02_FULL_46_47]OGL74630.1 MAG: antirepressor [Candidatus Uhrbacteria bacterium RIFCSPHIGHO2_12_FULL_47_11]OGL81422.1 MAG: antirepressor [Candidatus Uhrbacteria bacterium RIFCSPLOWO2_01_FULL_47_24]OGL83690.1 MAG: antirepressor [Candidatus Uhrbacteria bacterium RIFCSPLOWO2_02_FULL_46_25]OGL93093.1 MAG: antirepressor [Candidatus Uhrbacteria
MKHNKQIALFEGQKIRRHWDAEKELWYFSVVDIIQALIQQADYQTARKYWNKLKERLKKEGNESVTNCHQLKFTASDGKLYLTDAADVETILRLIQSVPSPKAEPIKLWLARVGYERIQETTDPEKSINRGRTNWQRMRRSEKWIQQRMMGQEIRNKLTDYWKNSEVKEQDEYAILTNIIHQEWSDLTVKEHKDLKNLNTQNLRDHMSDAELVFTALAELSTRQIAETMQTKGFEENKIPAKKGGRIAKNARKELENKTGKKVVSGENYLPSSKTTKKLK